MIGNERGYAMNKQEGWNVIKTLILCVFCMIVFYLCLRILQVDIFNQQRYELPEGPSVKVHQSDRR